MNVEANAMASLKHQGSWVHFDREFIRLSGYEKFRPAWPITISRTYDAVGDIEIHAIWKIRIRRIRVNEFCREIRVKGIRSRPQLYDELVCYLHVTGFARI